MKDNVNAGYWPGSPTRTCTLYTESYMLHWYHTKHQIPSTAAMKYMEVTGKMSTEYGRVCFKYFPFILFLFNLLDSSLTIQNPTINPIMFRTASSHFSYLHHKIDIEIRLQNKMKCPACVLPCMYTHFDVIFKLY